MELDLYQVDAFSQSSFGGNPAAVCPLTEWLPDEVMQNIAAENNLAETAFFVKTSSDYEIRWFTPTTEVDLCGHATLASAYVLFEQLNFSEAEITFHSKSGPLSVKRVADKLQLNFPNQKPVPCDTPAGLIEAFGKAPVQTLKSQDYIAVFDDEAFVKNVEPNLAVLKKLDLRGVLITSKSTDYDFVNRFFAPNYGIDEDPVTGSAFTKLIPYWAEQLGKTVLSAKQVSKRGGEVFCELQNDRVLISGHCCLYLVGKIFI